MQVLAPPQGMADQRRVALDGMIQIQMDLAAISDHLGSPLAAGIRHDGLILHFNRHDTQSLVGIGTEAEPTGEVVSVERSKTGGGNGDRLP